MGDRLMAINKAFLGHGIWLELNPLEGLRRYANYKKPLPAGYTTGDLVDKFIEAVTDMKMSSVWFEIFTSRGTIDRDGKQGTSELVAGLKAAKIDAIPWGYCWGTNSENTDPKKNDLELTKTLCDKYKLDCFVIDIEPWNKVNGKVDVWDAKALDTLATGLNSHFTKDCLGISSFAFLDANKQPHARKLLPPIAPLVSFCAPQVYWYKQDPIAWTQKSLLSWRNAGITTELIATVQSYWVDKDVTKSEMESAVTKFTESFLDADWSKVVGLNWYHAGTSTKKGQGAMSDEMIGAIIKGKLDQKPYKKPN
jgi:hypothetical protein